MKSSLTWQIYEWLHRYGVRLGDGATASETRSAVYVLLIHPERSSDLEGSISDAVRGTLCEVMTSAQSNSSVRGDTTGSVKSWSAKMVDDEGTKTIEIAWVP